jgi:hypothetical protein
MIYPFAIDAGPSLSLRDFSLLTIFFSNIRWLRKQICPFCFRLTYQK